MLDIQEKTLKGFTFIDLFAGIGGFHYALSSLGAKCVFASEWDKAAQKVYFENFGIVPAGDITKIEASTIPSHDILCGGFPCQAFSISGNQKGFDDVRGTLFFDIVRIASYHKPKILFLENVKNLLKHDGGKTFSVIQSKLEGLGYRVFYKVLNSSNFGLPQHRERIYIVAFRNDIPKAEQFRFPTENILSKLSDILEKKSDAKVVERNDIVIEKDFSCSNTLFGEMLPNKPIQIGKVNKGGQGERIYHPVGHAITLSAYGGGVGSKTGLYLIDGKVRKLSPRECARVQGFPDTFIMDKNQNQAYKQFGNSVSINVLQEVSVEFSKVL